MKSTPASTRSRSGSSFATVAMPLSRLPCFTPRMLTVATVAKLAMSSSAAHDRLLEHREQLRGVRREHGAHRGDGRGAEQPDQHAGEKADVGTERELDVRVRAAGERDAAARFGEAEHDESHRDRAHDVRERGRGAECGSDVGREAEDAAADGDVDDACGERPRADGPNERTFGGGTRFGHARAIAGRLRSAANGERLRSITCQEGGPLDVGA